MDYQWLSSVTSFYNNKNWRRQDTKFRVKNFLFDLVNILFPQISIFLDEGFHHLNTVRILEETDGHTLISHYLFSEGWEVEVLSDQNSVKLGLNKYLYIYDGWAQTQTDVLIL